MKWLLLGFCLVLWACGRTDLSSAQRSHDDGGVLHTADPLQGVWGPDEDVPGPRIYQNRQLSFTDGAWKNQVAIGNAYQDGRQVDVGTYVLAGTVVTMKTTASSCQSLRKITNPAATFERHGDKMTMVWQSDSASALPPETLLLSRVATLSDVGMTGCNVPTVGTDTTFRPHAVTPVP